MLMLARVVVASALRIGKAQSSEAGRSCRRDGRDP
jgi:hypothetical protein